MSDALAWRGFVVLQAPDGTEALNIAREYGGTIHVLCSDCVMPGLPVKQFVASFRQVRPR